MKYTGTTQLTSGETGALIPRMLSALSKTDISGRGEDSGYKKYTSGSSVPV
jgi:hypothetical protein